MRAHHTPFPPAPQVRNRETAGFSTTVCKGRSVQQIVQVSYDVSDPKVRKRELRGAQNAAAATRCRNLTRVTYDERGDWATPNGLPIEIVPAHEWLCRK
jgi:predicted AAA+ superfamily ATPase